MKKKTANKYDYITVMAERCGNKQKDNEVETMICPIEYVRKCGKKDGTKVLEKREKKQREVIGGDSGTGLLLNGSGQGASDGCLGLYSKTTFTSACGGEAL